MMNRIVNATSRLGVGIIGLGIMKEFFIYDGKSILIFIIIKLNSSFFSTQLSVYIYEVDAGNRAVIFDKFRGIQPAAVGEGTHLKIPFIQVR
jgi:hypothetical protein